jgi:hypothetical protein
MPNQRINCPNCRQPIMVEIEQLFDVGANPDAKQRLLSGAFNIIQCPHCGYQGTAATPIVYHDPEKQLLLTFFPPDLTRTRDEQERSIGPLINQAINRLPQEKRRGYLFNPQTVLTMQGLVERILEADGITKEMMQAQQQRLNLVQRLLSASDDVVEEIARQEDKTMDTDFFSILNRLVEAASMQGDRESAEKINELQKKLLPLTTTGRQLEEQSREVEAAIRSLQEAGENLTREKLLDMVVNAPNDTHLSVLVSFARPGMDYEFFRLLSERIDRARGTGRERLIELREKLLEMTREIDRQVEARQSQTKKILDEILKQPDIQKTVEENLDAIDEFFVQVVNAEMNQARQEGDLERIQKLQQVIGVLQKASAPPPEIELIEELLDADTDEERRVWLEEHREDVTQKFMDTLMGFMAQLEGGEEPELYERMQKAYRSALRFKMESNLKQ